MGGLPTRAELLKETILLIPGIVIADLLADFLKHLF